MGIGIEALKHVWIHQLQIYVAIEKDNAEVANVIENLLDFIKSKKRLKKIGKSVDISNVKHYISRPTLYVYRMYLTRKWINLFQGGIKNEN